MGETKQNLAVGLTGLAALAGIIALLVLFGHIPGWGQRQGYQVIIHVLSANGLHPGSEVRLSGLDVGDIQSVRFRRNPADGVVAVAKIRPKIKIPASVTAHVTTSLFGGSAILDFTMSPELQKKYRLNEKGVKFLPRTGEPAIVQGTSRSIVAQLSRLSQTWNTFGKNINKLVEPRTIGAVDSGKQPGNMATVLERLDKRVKAMKVMMANVQKILGDKNFRGNIRQIAANVNQLSKKLNKQADPLIKSIKSNVNKLGNHYVSLADHLSKASDSLKKFADKAVNGKGTMGKLLNNPSLYNNINDAILQLKAAANQGKLLIEKWKAEGLPVHF